MHFTLKHTSTQTRHIHVLFIHIWLVTSKHYSSAPALWRGCLWKVGHPASTHFLVNSTWSFRALRTHDLSPFFQYKIKTWIPSPSPLSATSTCSSHWLSQLSVQIKSSAGTWQNRIQSCEIVCCYCGEGGREAGGLGAGNPVWDLSLLVSFLILHERLSVPSGHPARFLRFLPTQRIKLFN